MPEVLDWTKMTAEEKKKQLFLRQKELLDLYLEKKAITQADYDKSMKRLQEKMGAFHVEGFKVDDMESDTKEP